MENKTKEQAIMGISAVIVLMNVVCAIISGVWANKKPIAGND